MESFALGVALAVLSTTPLAWKWQLGVRRSAAFVLVVACAAGALVAALRLVVPLGPVVASAAVWLLTLLVTAGFLAFRFFRDPERPAVPRDDVVLSPADGEVVYVRRFESGVLPVAEKHGRSYTLTELTRTQVQTDDAVVVGIGMSFLDVHVNRAPVAGRVRAVDHFAGSFGSLREPEMVFQNERVTTVIVAPHLEVAVVQIASRLVRQIVTFVRQDEEVALGQRIGMIRFGSQVDVVMPARGDLVVSVSVGDRVRAGESLLATRTTAIPPVAHVALSGDALAAQAERSGA